MPEPVAVWLWMWSQSRKEWEHVCLTGYPGTRPDSPPPTSSTTTPEAQTEALDALGGIQGAIRGRRGVEAPPAGPVPTRRRRRKKAVVATEAEEE